MHTPASYCCPGSLLDRRVSIVAVGYRRRPFSVLLRNLTLIEIAQSLNIDQYDSRWMRYSQASQRSALPIHDRAVAADPSQCFHLQLFTAVRSGTSAFLQLQDPDTDALMRIQDDSGTSDALLAMYLTPENAITRDGQHLRKHVIAAVEQTQQQSHDDQTIHLLAVLRRGLQPSSPLIPDVVAPVCVNQIVLDYHVGAWIGATPEDFASSVSVTALLHGSVADLGFHRRQHINTGPSFELASVLNTASSSSDCAFESLPRFQRIVVTRALCMRHQRTPVVRYVPPRPPSPPPSPSSGSGPLSLLRLAADAALRAVLHEDPPQFVDAVDCVMEVALYDGSECVLEQVVCFVKFDRAVADLAMVGDLYVNPRMLAALDMIVTLGDDAMRPRLLMFADWNASPYRMTPINQACLPAAFPSIVAKSNHFL